MEQRWGRQNEEERNWLVGHQRPWIFERILLVANSEFAEGINCHFQRNLYTLERVKTSAEALRRLMHSDFEVVLCQLTPDFPAEMFYRGLERVRPYLLKRLLFFIDANTDSAVAAFIRKMKIATIWYPSDPHIIFETITGVIKKTTSMTGFAGAAQVKIVSARRVSE